MKVLRILPVLLLLTWGARAAVWYVDIGNTSGTEDGLSWLTAFTEIQPAIDAASAACGGEVWVAEGTYGEARSSIVHPAPDALDTGSVLMKEGVDLYGGFVGLGPGGEETERSQRNWQTHVTTIDGSVARGGLPAYHVVVGAHNSTLDGFTVTGGDAAGSAELYSPANYGGGMYNGTIVVVVQNCVFSKNRATTYGGGVCNDHSSATISNCGFSGNAAYSSASGCGGAITNVMASVNVADCVLTDNDARGNYGGAIFNWDNSYAFIARSTFQLNTVAWFGGGVNNRSSSATVTDCEFLDNSGAFAGAIHNSSAILTVAGCVFRGNVAVYDYGGAVHDADYANSSRPNVTSIRNSVFSLNSSDYGAAVCVQGTGSGGQFTATNCIFFDNMAVLNGSAIAVDSKPNTKIVNCTVAHNVASTGGSAMWFADTGTGPQVVNCVAWNDFPSEISADASSSPTVSYSNVQGGYSGSFNIAADPLFLDELGRDLRVQSGSPCIDTGMDTSGSGYGTVSTDFYGDPRGIDGDGRGTGSTGDGSDYDMGADEAGTPTVPVIELTPSSPFTDEPIVCTVTTECQSRPRATVLYEYVWTNGSATLVRDLKDALTDTLGAQYTLKHETWTCVVRGWDGLLFSPPASIPVIIQNRPPGPLELAIPAIQSTSANLRCELFKAPDPDGDVVYTVQWYANGEPWPGPVTTVDTYTQVDNTHTQAGDQWYCEVTYGDGESPNLVETSTTCIIVAGGIVPSYVSLSTNPDTVTLGESLMAFGRVFPSPVGSPNATFTSASPSGGVSEVFPEGTVISGGSFTKSFVPTEASEGRGPWSLTATWPGDATYQSATSAAVSFTVLRGQPALTVLLNASSVPLGYDGLEASVAFSAPIPALLKQAPHNLIEGRQVDVYLRKPDASSVGPVTGYTDADGVAAFDLTAFANEGISFTEAGTWQFLAEFSGDDNFVPAMSPGYELPNSARLTVKDGAGYAVIVVGKLDEDGEGQAEHTKTADFVYRAFRDRGFAAEDIWYMAEGEADPYPDVHVDDTTPSEAEIQWAIETWAGEAMNVSPGPLYVVFLDHGREDAFYVYSGSYDGTRTITPTELDGYLYNLEESLTPAALASDRIVVYGACHSGSIIDTVSKSGRVIITSSSEAEVSHRGVANPADGTDVRDGEPFVTELFRSAREGKSLKASFEAASSRIEEYTAEQTNGVALELVPQHPLLDDNGDGVGTWRQGLLVAPGYDGARSHEIIVGYGVNASGAVGWIEASRTTVLDPGDPLELYARATEVGGSHTAWCEVKTPAYVGADEAAMGVGAGGDDLGDFQQVVTLLPFVYEPAISDVTGTGTYRWRDQADFQTSFTDPGTYQVYYYLQDGTSLETSAHLLTTVYRLSATNTPPNPVTLLLPADGAEENTAAYFHWATGTDPDGDPVRYRIELAEDAAFTAGLVSRDNLHETYTQAPGVEDGKTYYWRVLVVDQYGAESTGNTVRVVDFDNDNTEEYGALEGRVTDALSGEGIGSASVTVSRFGMTPRTVMTDFAGQYFCGNLAQGDYGVSVSASDYRAAPGPGAYVSEGNTAHANVSLTPLDAPFLWGEVSGDGAVGTMDASQILQWKVLLIDRFAVDESVTFPAYPPCADVTGDATLGTLDARAILEHKVGLISHFAADVDGDGWGPESGKRVALETRSTPKAARQGTPRVLSIGMPEGAQAGDVIEVPVFLEDAAGVLGYTGSFSSTPGALWLTSVRGGRLTAAWPAPVASVTDGRVRIAHAGATPLEDGGVLCVLRFLVEDATALSLICDAAELNDGAIPVTVAQ